MWTRSPRSSAERCGRALLLALLLLGPLAGLGSPVAGAVPAAEARSRARQALADPRYQRQLPARKAEKLPPAPRRRPSFGRMPRIHLPFLGIAASVAQLVFFALLTVVVILVVLWLVSEIRRRRSRAGQADPGLAAGGRAPGEGDLPSAQEAARLAGEGRYGEAVHALLLAAIGQLAARGRRTLPPHLTSRELARALPLSPDSLAVFRDLVASVEGWLFGGLPLEREDYERCRERFLRLTGGGAA